MAGKSKLLWVSRDPVPANVRLAVEDRWELSACSPGEPLRAQLRGSSLALIHANGEANDARFLGKVLGDLERSSAVAVFLLPPRRQAPVAWELLSRQVGQFVCVAQDVAPQELTAKLSAAAELQPVIMSLQEELSQARGAAEGPGREGKDLTQEMHLAARLQRDFLPRRLPEVGPVRFAVLYRPASWVSGDIYDVTRLDETNVGFYVADAVGHGLPAALLTMFIKKALQTKRIVGHNYEIIPPDVSLAGLNRDICQQGLTSCQFCTAVYCVLDTRTLTLTYARAGHPEPVLLRGDGGLERLDGKGSLLGIFHEEQFECRQVRLAPGDRLVLYSDGAESVLCGPKATTEDVERAIAQWRGMPRDELVLELTAMLGGQPPAKIEDDVTIVVADVAK
ncbi:MAG TPA: PP2C family protein-serine/threonine phosphatase [Phycisphaerae bacterium]|nr:PP2C family protein-serine/threonine phosphatase [Phycisphaerae bacterium]